MRTSLTIRATIQAWVGFLGLAVSSGAMAADPSVPIRLLHTNDLHSHFRAEKTPLALGGVARLKTAITRARAAVPHSLLVDGGDWSEGHIYYNEGAGRETLRMMDHLGYDVAVVGNHDWFNGIETLLGAIQSAAPAMQLVASNLDVSAAAQAAEFRRRIPPYVIKELGGVRIAFVGLVTYEFIYDKYLKPIKVTEPFASTRKLASELKRAGVDAVIAISHNSVRTNEGILKAAPELDMIVGAHDHVKLTEPVVVERPGAKPAWIVETGCWGHYLGQVDLKIIPRGGGIEYVSYRLEQMDRSVAEDPETLGRIAALEAVIEAKRGPIFHDHVGTSEIEISREGAENLMGNFATDAYLAAAPEADIAIDQTAFIYEQLHRGVSTTADVFNSNPGVYDPRTDKAWTLRLLPIRGRSLSVMLNLLFSTSTVTQRGPINFSGVDVVYQSPFKLGLRGRALLSMGNGVDSWGDLAAFAATPTLAPMMLDPQGISIKSLKIRGQEIDPNRTYLAAVSGGVVQALEFLEGVLPGAIPLRDLKDTGREDWRIIGDHLAAHSPVRPETIPFGRIHTVDADLGLLPHDVRWEPASRDPAGNVTARVKVTVRNTGARAARAGASVRLLLNERGVDLAVTPQYRVAGAAATLGALAPGAEQELVWHGVVVPQTLGIHALTARVEGNSGDLNPSNDEVTVYFAD